MDNSKLATLHLLPFNQPVPPSIDAPQAPTMTSAAAPVPVGEAIELPSAEGWALWHRLAAGQPAANHTPMHLYPYPLRKDAAPRIMPAFGLCDCHPSRCCAGQVTAGRLPNGDLCRAAIPACQQPVEHPTADLQRRAYRSAVQ